jgi:uncharacterized membrane protein YgcG
MSSVPGTGEDRISLRRVVGRRLLFRLLVANVITYVVVSGQLAGTTSLGGTLGGLVTGGALLLVSGVVVGFSLVPEYLRVHHPRLYELVGGSGRHRRGTDHTSMHDDYDPDDRDGSFFGGLFGGDGGDGGGGFDFGGGGGGGGGDDGGGE